MGSGRIIESGVVSSAEEMSTMGKVTRLPRTPQPHGRLDALEQALDWLVDLTREVSVLRERDRKSVV